MTAPEPVEPLNPRAGVMGPANPVSQPQRRVRTRESASCSQCSARWTSHRVAHRAGCCETFTTVALFDRHRRAYTCVDPATIDGMREVGGIWRGPEMDDAAKLARFGARP